jgi:Ca2+-binding EF-hand superfamily protein
MIKRAFDKFDKDGSGYVDVQDLIDTYDTSFHPKVISGELTHMQVLEQFLDNFNDANNDGRIVYEEWLDYYAAVSSNMDSDEHFVLLMKNTWQLDRD